MKKNLMTKLLAVMLILSLFVTLTACGGKDKKSSVKFEGVSNAWIDALTEFDPLAGVTAKGDKDVDLTADIKVKGEVDILTPGEYTLTYSVDGYDTTVNRTVTVKDVEAVRANGVFNMKFADPDTRHTFMAAAENYLLHNQYAGVPLFANAGFNLYSNRMQLMSDEYIPVMGFGTVYSTLSEDDSTVIMEDGKAGKAGEYTFRTALSGNPTQWNQWLYDDSITSDVMTHYYGTLYDYEFNADKTGYVLVPSMAAGDPVAVNSTTLPSGKEVSKVWQIEIKDGLKWKFNDKTDTSMITKHTIDATDFYETYKIALTEKWFRAISGGGDFCASSQKIVNAQAYVDGTAKWEDVGIKLVNDSTIEFHYVQDQSQWNVKYGMGSFVMSPINIEMYKSLGEKYGTDENTIAYSGPYYVDYYESDKIVRYKKNDLYHDADKFFYTGQTMTIIADAEMRFQEFVAGKLDAAGLPTGHYDDYKNHPGLKRVPGATTFRLMINGFGTMDAAREKFEEVKWEPKPILANQDFKMALYHAIDRQKLAEEVLKTSQTQMYLFTDAYVVEAEAGIPYRSTPQGEAVGSDLSPSTFGYNFDAAKAYYEKAITKLVEDGVYKDGDEIELEFFFFAGSDAQELLSAYLKDAFESAFTTDKHDITFKFTGSAKEFPGIYYDYMMLAEMDTAVGGISGSTLDAASFLDVFCSDNRGGFTLNWGIDTSVPEITVVYENNDGEYVKELWSFDAITAALNGEVELVDGAEKPSE